MILIHSLKIIVASPQAAQGVGLSTPGPRHTPSHKASPTGFPLLSLTKNAAYNYFGWFIICTFSNANVGQKFKNTRMDWRYNRIWFEQIDSQKKVTWDCKETSIHSLSLDNITYATLWYLKYKGSSFEISPKSDSLLYLQLNSANIQDFSVIKKYKNLKRVELHYCTKVESDNDISYLQDSIEFLYIEHSKKLNSLNEINKLHKLKVLCLNNCGPLKSLNFLNNFPNLIDFRFVNTNIVDGDLTPIIKHPTLRSVGFLNKRHYNYKDIEIDSILKNKSEEDLRDEVFKGEFMTFKYKNFEAGGLVSDKM